MAETKKMGEAAEAVASPSAPAYHVVDLAPDAEVYIPLICRQVKVAELDQAQLAQLHALGWPHARSGGPC